MDTNNLDFIRQAVLFTKQNNLAYKKVFAFGPSSNKFYAIKVISVDPAATDFETSEQDKDYYITTFLTDGTEDWTKWLGELSNKGWYILSATEQRQKGSKNTTNIPKAPDYKFKTEFLSTEVSPDRPKIRPLGFLENFAAPGAGSTTGLWGSLSRRGFPGLSTPSYQSVVGDPTLDYKGVTDNSGKFERSYSIPYASSNLIHNYFNKLSDKDKIEIGWSGGDFLVWWEDAYTNSAVKEEGVNENFTIEDNPEATATFNQIVPMKTDLSSPSFLSYRDEKYQEWLRNPDKDKGNFVLPLPSQNDLDIHGDFGKTFFELGYEKDLTSKEVDPQIISALLKQLMSQVRIDQSIDEINRKREEALNQALEAGKKSKKSFDASANIFTNLMKKVKD